MCFCDLVTIATEKNYAVTDWLSTMKRIHIGVSDDMHKCVKLFATYHDITVNDLVCKSIRMYLENQKDYECAAFLEDEIKRMDIDKETTE